MYTNEVLSTKTVSDLYKIAKEMGLSGYSKARKSDVIQLILDNQAVDNEEYDISSKIIHEDTSPVDNESTTNSMDADSEKNNPVLRMNLPQNRAQRRKFQAQMRKKIINKHKKAYGSL